MTLPAPLAHDASDAASWHAKGRQLLQQEHYAEAIPALTQAVTLDPSLAPAFNARGYANLRLKHYAEAIEDFDRAIRLQPGYQNAYANRATARRLSGDATAAAADMATARGLARGAQ